MLLNFDYDGVIVDSAEQLLSLIAQAQEMIGAGRAPTMHDLQTIEKLTLEDLGAHIGIAEELMPAFAKTLFALQENNWRVEPFAEIVSVLHELSKLHTLTVITSSVTSAVARTLNEFGLKESVYEVLGGESGVSKADRIERVRGGLNLEKDQTFMIGDAISDIRQGKAAGVKTIAVTWGYQDAALLTDEAPDFVVHTPAELLGVF